MLDKSWECFILYKDGTEKGRWVIVDNPHIEFAASVEVSLHNLLNPDDEWKYCVERRESKE